MTSQVNEDQVFVSVVTITELRYGVERLAIGKCRERVDRWLRKDLILTFRRKNPAS
jgi:toxin FitB